MARAEAQVETKVGNRPALNNNGGASQAVQQAPRIGLEDKDKHRALTQTVAQIEKTFGKGSIMRLDEDAYLNIPGISTGCISLDLALGARASPAADRRGLRPGILRQDHHRTHRRRQRAESRRRRRVHRRGARPRPSWARRIGVNIDELLVSQPDSGEQALEICELLVRSSAST
jgi:recombination protein RecA